MKKFQFVNIDLSEQTFATEIIEEETVVKAVVLYYNDPELPIEAIQLKSNRDGGWKIEGEENMICIMEVAE